MKGRFKKVVSFLLALSLIVIPALSVNANEVNPAIVDTDGIQIVKISDNQEVVTFGNVTIEDTLTSEYRKIVTVCGDTTSVYYEDISTGIATMSVNGVVTETYDMNALRSNYETWEMPEEDAVLIENTLSSVEPGEAVILPPELKEKYKVTQESDSPVYITPIENESQSVARAATFDVKPDGPVTDTYPEYTYKKVSTKSQYSSVCGRYLNMSIKDSMYSYTRSSHKKYYYDAGTAVSIIAGALKIATGTLVSSLQGYTTIVSGVLKLSSNINYYFSESYSFSALRQGCIYDYTKNYSDVSVKTEYGNGEISMTWDYVNNQYTNPAWRITGIAYPHTIAFSEMYENIKDIWEFNMTEYGYWKWGNV